MTEKLMFEAPQKGDGHATGLDHHTGTNSHTCICRQQALRSSNDRDAHPASGRDLQRECFLRSLLRDLPVCDQSQRRTEICCCAEHSDRQRSVERTP